jgi:hypothetical protein
MLILNVLVTCVKLAYPYLDLCSTYNHFPASRAKTTNLSSPSDLLARSLPALRPTTSGSFRNRRSKRRPDQPRLLALVQQPLIQLNYKQMTFTISDELSELVFIPDVLSVIVENISDSERLLFRLVSPTFSLSTTISLKKRTDYLNSLSLVRWAFANLPGFMMPSSSAQKALLMQTLRAGDMEVLYELVVIYNCALSPSAFEEAASTGRVDQWSFFSNMDVRGIRIRISRTWLQGMVTLG